MKRRKKNSKEIPKKEKDIKSQPIKIKEKKRIPKCNLWSAKINSGKKQIIFKKKRALMKLLKK